MRLLVLLSCLGLAACAAVSGASDRAPPFTTQAAAAVAPSQPDFPLSVDLPSGNYRLDPRHASVIFRIRHMGLAWFSARFDAKTAALTLDPADPSRSRLAASISANSVNTGVSNTAGERAFDRSIGHALGEAQTPEINFVSTLIERTGEHTARVTGDLTMNGQTHPMTLDVTFAGAAVDPLRGGAMVLGFSAHGVIERSQWGVTEWRTFTGDEVQIIVEAELVRA